MQHSFNDWTVVEKLGEGGMCAVFRVRRGEEERAVKVLLDDSTSTRHRFVTEAKILAGIDHPHVIRVHHLEDHDPPWLMMDLLGGRDLAHHRDGEDSAPEQVARWIAEAASGLAAVHEAGLVHRDLKPANLVLGEDGLVRLIDFGLARATTDAHQTAKGVVMGTASYLAPELYTSPDPQADQDSPVTEVYSLGQTLCELLIGRPVYAEAEAKGVLVARLMGEKLERECLDPREWKEGLPNGLAAIVMRATDRDPERRTGTAKALEQELRTWLEQRERTEAAPVSEVSTLSALPSPPSPLVPRKKRSWLKLGAASLVVVINVGMIGLTGAAVVGLWVTRPAPSLLAKQVRADARVPNCVQRAVRFTIEGTGDGVVIAGLTESEAACVEILGWHAPAGERAVVEVH